MSSSNYSPLDVGRFRPRRSLFRIVRNAVEDLGAGLLAVVVFLVTLVGVLTIRALVAGWAVMLLIGILASHNLVSGTLGYWPSVAVGACLVVIIAPFQSRLSS